MQLGVPRRIVIVLNALCAAHTLRAQIPAALIKPYTEAECPKCGAWRAPQTPMRVFGNTYYVGTDGISAILITSDAGHVLIDAGIPEAAPTVIASIRALGFRVEDVKAIVTSHVHYDHAGGVAAIQYVSHARVLARAWSAVVLRAGKSSDDDPQGRIALAFPAVPNVEDIAPEDTVRVGPLRVVAHATAGHTPGGTSWSWESCEAGRCVGLAYVDSQTPVSDEDFHYVNSTRYPSALADFAKGQELISRLRCDVLLTPHPASDLFERLKSRSNLINPESCRDFARDAKAGVAARVVRENGTRP